MNYLPKVSVIITTFSRPNFLIRAINSVLNQTYKLIEVCVVDDNDPLSIYRKETEDLLYDYIKNDKINYIKHSSNLNASTARNTGIKNTNGELIAFLDDDDEFYPDKIRQQVEYLGRLDKSWGGCQCDFEICENGKQIQKVTNLDEGDLTKFMLLIKGPTCMMSTSIIHREVANELSGFDTTFRRYQDYEFFLRFFRNYKMAKVPEVLSRINIDSRSNQFNLKNAYDYKILFLEKFKDDIEKLPEMDTIYRRQWFYVSIIFFKSKKFRKGIRVLQHGLVYSNLSIHEYLHLVSTIVDAYIPVKKIIKKIIR